VIRFSFNVEKSAQAAAFLVKLNGGDLDTYKFIKMLYFADREAFNRWDEPITGDHAASMQFGPVLSTIYDLTKGDCPFYHEKWAQFLTDTEKETHLIFLKADPGTRLLSRSEMEILETVYRTFKDYTWRQLRDFSHQLHEYDKSVGTGSRHIPVETILKALKKTEAQIAEVREVEDSKRSLEALFS
jgi:uncharacterized phage-associated protein